MQTNVFADTGLLAREAARLVARAARQAVDTRGRFLMAVSGGNTPWKMLDALSKMDVPWAETHVFQVDERITPVHEERNITHIRRHLVNNASLPAAQLYPMPVDDDELDAALGRYAATLRTLAGSPPTLDLVHLGLGTDGHTASLVPGDPVLRIRGDAVALTGVYQEHRRITLSYPVLNRARHVLWLVAGEAKAEMLCRLKSADPDIPAGRVNQAHATVFADRAAAGVAEARQARRS